MKTSLVMRRLQQHPRNVPFPTSTMVSLSSHLLATKQGALLRSRSQPAPLLRSRQRPAPISKPKGAETQPALKRVKPPSPKEAQVVVARPRFCLVPALSDDALRAYTAAYARGGALRLHRRAEIERLQTILESGGATQPVSVVVEAEMRIAW